MVERRGYRCIHCRCEVATWMLVSCPICGSSVCHNCATLGYGRIFCSRQCSEFFFHGDPEDDEREDG